MTAVTGLVDAFSYLVLGHVFVANMTGNVVFLGFALAGAPGFSVTASVVAIGSFALGALIGGMVGSRYGRHRGRLLALGATVQAALLAASALLAALAGGSVTAGYRYSLIVLLGAAMGVQNAVARKLSVPDLTTTVLTLTITATAADSSIAHGPGSKMGRRLLAVVTMLAGGLIGPSWYSTPRCTTRSLSPSPGSWSWPWPPGGWGGGPVVDDTWVAVRAMATRVFPRRRRGGYGGDASRPRPDLPMGTDLLPEVGHIVVLMMENHSYDNYLGLLGKGDGLPIGPDGKPEAVNLRSDGRPVRAFHLATTQQVEHVPTQSWRASHLQYDGGRNDGFVRSAEETVEGGAEHAELAMGYWEAGDIPFYYWMAKNFPVVDRWFSSCLGPTIPNRRFLIAGTANGLVDDRAIDLLGYPPSGTVFDQLDRAGVTWANYHAAPRSRVWVAQLFGRSLRSAARAVLTALRGRWGVKLKSSKPEPASAMFQFTVDSFPVAWPASSAT